MRCFFCGGDHFVAECPKKAEPGFDIDQVIDKWADYQNEEKKNNSHREEAKAKDIKHQAGKWKLKVKSSTGDNIAEADINLLLDIIDDDDWVLEWQEDHLKECIIGGLASDAEMQSLGTRIRRKLPKVKVESLGLMPSYDAAPTNSSPTQVMTKMPEAEAAKLNTLEAEMNTVTGDISELKDQKCCHQCAHGPHGWIPHTATCGTTEG